uniref:Uncharacterized protein n=1 Tax=Daphnia magna TaxID=35525 RepID=A0A0P5G2P9_9CRUS
MLLEGDHTTDPFFKSRVTGKSYRRSQCVFLSEICGHAKTLALCVCKSKSCQGTRDLAQMPKRWFSLHESKKKTFFFGI